MGDLAEPFGNGSADLEPWTVDPHQRRKPGFDLLVPALQRIILGVRDDWRILAVIGLVMPGKLGGKPLKLGLRLGFTQSVNGLGFIGHLQHSGIVSVLAQSAGMKRQTGAVERNQSAVKTWGVHCLAAAPSVCGEGSMAK